jgi:hypothetical protein
MPYKLLPPKRAVRPITASAAPNSEPTWIAALRQATAGKRRGSSSSGVKKPNVLPFPGR